MKGLSVSVTWQLLGISLRLRVQALQSLPAILTPNSLLSGVVDSLRFNHILTWSVHHVPSLMRSPWLNTTILNSQLPSMNSLRQAKYFRYFWKPVFKLTIFLLYCDWNVLECIILQSWVLSEFQTESRKSSLCIGLATVLCFLSPALLAQCFRSW